MPKSSRPRKPNSSRHNRRSRHLDNTNAYSPMDDIRAVVSGLGVGFIVVVLFSLGTLRLVFVGILFIARRLFPKQRYRRQRISVGLLRTTTDTVLDEELQAYFEDSCRHWKQKGHPVWRIVISALWFFLGAIYAKVMSLIQLQFHRSL